MITDAILRVEAVRERGHPGHCLVQGGAGRFEKRGNENDVEINEGERWNCNNL